MDEFQRAVWLDKLEKLKQQAEDGDAYELMYIFGTIYAALEQGQLPQLKEQYSKFVDTRIREIEEHLRTLEGRLEDSIVEQARGIISSPYEDFKLKDEHDDHFPFDQNSEEDQCV